MINSTAFVLIFFGIMGAVFIFIPTKILLPRDETTGRWIYEQVLKEKKDEDLAIQCAGMFYKITGSIVFVISVTLLVVLYKFGLIKSQPGAAANGEDTRKLPSVEKPKTP